jgi:hypothetical protein
LLLLLLIFGLVADVGIVGAADFGDYARYGLGWQCLLAAIVLAGEGLRNKTLTHNKKAKRIKHYIKTMFFIVSMFGHFCVPDVILVENCTVVQN